MAMGPFAPRPPAVAARPGHGEDACVDPILRPHLARPPKPVRASVHRVLSSPEASVEDSPEGSANGHGVVPCPHQTFPHAAACTSPSPRKTDGTNAIRNIRRRLLEPVSPPGGRDPTETHERRAPCVPLATNATQKLLIANWSPLRVMSASALQSWGCLGLPTVPLARIASWAATVRQRQPWPSHG